jgi:hypothetical protein
MKTSRALKSKKIYVKIFVKREVNLNLRTDQFKSTRPSLDLSIKMIHMSLFQIQKIVGRRCCSKGTKVKKVSKPGPPKHIEVAPTQTAKATL